MTDQMISGNKKNHHNHNRHVQNDGIIFLILVQIEYFFTRFVNKRSQEFYEWNVPRPIEIILLHS
jgi:hypothetical protein